MKKKLTSECPECGSSNVIYNKDKDQLVCQDCGIIFEELAPEDEQIEEEVSREAVPKAKVKKAKKK